VTDMLQDVFKWLESIYVTKRNLMVTEEDEVRYAKCRWLIHKAMSFAPDMVETVNMINGLSDMSPRMEYDVLLGCVPIANRRPKWAKKAAPSLYLDAVREYYGYTESKAEQAMKLLSVEQLAIIDKKIQKKDETSWVTFSGASE
jgi:hypothetical protein